MSQRQIIVAILAASWLSISSQPAHAYLDPGTGSILLQLLLGGLAGAAVIGSTYWNRLRQLLGFTPARKDEPSDDERR